MTPSEKTVKLLRSLNWTTERVERDCRFEDPKTHEVRQFKKDMLGCGDYIALTKGRILLVQCTNAANLANHIQKILAEPKHKAWLEAGGELCCIGWHPESHKQPRVVAWIDGKPTETTALDWLLRGKETATA